MEKNALTIRSSTPPCFANAVANQNVDMYQILIIPKILCVLGQVVRPSLSPERTDRGGLGQSLTGTWQHSARNSVNKVIVLLPLQLHLFSKTAQYPIYVMFVVWF